MNSQFDCRARPTPAPPIIDALRQADALVLASPVYYYGVTAQTKLAIDRFFALIQEGMSVKRAALLITCGESSESAADPSVGMFRRICGYQKWEEAGVIVAPGCAQTPALPQSRDFHLSTDYS